jgi:hypothetical protein
MPMKSYTTFNGEPMKGVEVIPQAIPVQDQNYQALSAHGYVVQVNNNTPTRCIRCCVGLCIFSFCAILAGILAIYYGLIHCHGGDVIKGSCPGYHPANKTGKLFLEKPTNVRRNCAICCVYHIQIAPWRNLSNFSEFDWALLWMERRHLLY